MELDELLLAAALAAAWWLASASLVLVLSRLFTNSAKVGILLVAPPSFLCTSGFSAENGPNKVIRVTSGSDLSTPVCYIT